MPYHSEQYTSFGIVKVVILCFTGNKGIGSVGHGLRDEESAAAATEGHIADFAVLHLGVTDGGKVENIFQLIEKLLFGHRIGKDACYAAAGLSLCIFQRIKVVGGVFVGVHGN